MSSTATANDRLPRPVRLIDQEDVRCPAGTACRAGNAVLCRVVESVIDARTDPSSLSAFCLGQYTECPIKQEDRRRAEAHLRSGDLRTG